MLLVCCCHNSLQLGHPSSTSNQRAGAKGHYRWPTLPYGPQLLFLVSSMLASTLEAAAASPRISHTGAASVVSTAKNAFTYLWQMLRLFKPEHACCQNNHNCCCNKSCCRWQLRGATAGLRVMVAVAEVDESDPKDKAVRHKPVIQSTGHSKSWDPPELRLRTTRCTQRSSHCSILGRCCGTRTPSCLLSPLLLLLKLTLLLPCVVQSCALTAPVLRSHCR